MLNPIPTNLVGINPWSREPLIRLPIAPGAQWQDQPRNRAPHEFLDPWEIKPWSPESQLHQSIAQSGQCLYQANNKSQHEFPVPWLPTEWSQEPTNPWLPADWYQRPTNPWLPADWNQQPTNPWLPADWNQQPTNPWLPAPWNQQTNYGNPSSNGILYHGVLNRVPPQIPTAIPPYYRRIDNLSSHSQKIAPAPKRHTKGLGNLKTVSANIVATLSSSNDTTSADSTSPSNNTAEAVNIDSTSASNDTARHVNLDSTSSSINTAKAVNIDLTSRLNNTAKSVDLDSTLPSNYIAKSVDVDSTLPSNYTARVVDPNSTSPSNNTTVPVDLDSTLPSNYIAKSVNLDTTLPSNYTARAVNIDSTSPSNYTARPVDLDTTSSNYIAKSVDLDSTLPSNYIVDHVTFPSSNDMSSTLNAGSKKLSKISSALRTVEEDVQYLYSVEPNEGKLVELVNLSKDLQVSQNQNLLQPESKNVHLTDNSYFETSDLTSLKCFTGDDPCSTLINNLKSYAQNTHEKYYRDACCNICNKSLIELHNKCDLYHAKCGHLFCVLCIKYLNFQSQCIKCNEAISSLRKIVL